MKPLVLLATCGLVLSLAFAGADQTSPLRVALVKQPFIPNGVSAGPTTMADGGIQAALATLGATVRVNQIALTKEQEPEYGGWKRLGYALGHLGRAVQANEREGFFNVGLLGTCPSMPGMVAGLQRSGPTDKPIRIALLWLDAHPDFNTPETTRSGSLGGMPVAVATGRCLTAMRLDAGLDPPLPDELVVMAGVRLTDPLEQELLDKSKIQHLTVADLQTMSPAVTRQMDRLSRLADKIYVHIDMDVLDPREVEGHQNKVPGGPTSEQLAALFEMIFSKYPKAAAIGFATIPANDPGKLSIAALNRMILGAVRGLQQRGGRAPEAAPSQYAALLEVPRLNASVRMMELRRKAPISTIVQAIGLTVSYDGHVPELNKIATVSLASASLEEALDVVLRANGIAYTVLGPTHVLAYSDTPANREKYEWSVRTFTIANADPGALTSVVYKQMLSAPGIRPIIIPATTPSRTITVRATGEKMAVIAKLIAENDKR